MVSSSFSGLSIALSALLAQRRAVDVTGHNVANANTPGFTRQELVLATRTPLPAPIGLWRLQAGQVGTGVEMARTRRLRDQFVDVQLRRQLHLLGHWRTTSEAMRRVEDTLLEPSDVNLAALMTKFWDAWDELGNAPRSAGARVSLLGQARSLASRLNGTYEQLAAMRREIDERLGVRLQDVNAVAQQIAALNAQIRNVQAGGDAPNDLRDRRDLLLDKLAEALTFQAFEDDHGSLSVYVGGTALVDGTTVNQISKDAAGTLVWERGGAAVDLHDGEFKALLTMRDAVLPTRMRQLDDVASALLAGVNALHETGFGLPDEFGVSATGQSFFTGTGAHDIAVATSLIDDPSAIAAAASPDSPGDGSLAQTIAAYRHVAVAALGGETIDGYYGGVIVQVGVEARESEDQVTNQGIVVDHLKQQRESLSGVSLDEEAANLVRFQHAYAAAAQFLSTVDDMLDHLINVVGAAGH